MAILLPRTRAGREREHMPTDSALPRNRMAVIVPASFLNSLGIGLTNLGLLFLVKDLYKASPAQVGWFGATWSIFYFSACILFKRFTDRLAPRVSMVIMLLGSALVMAAFLAFRGLFQAFAAYAVYGLLTAFFWPPLMGWLSRGLEGAALSKAAGMFNTSWSLGGVLAPWLGGVLYEHGRFLPVWAALSIFMANAVFVLVSRRLLPDPLENSGRAGSKEALPADRSTPLRFPAWLGVFVMYAAMGVVFNVFPVFARDELGASESFIGLMLTARSLASAAGFMLLGRLAFWQFKGAIIPLASAITAAVLLCLAFAGAPALYMTLFVVLGLAMAMTYTNSLFYATSGAPDRDRRASTHEALLTGGQVAGSVAGGMLYQGFSMTVVFLALGALVTAAALGQSAMIRAWKRKARA